MPLALMQGTLLFIYYCSTDYRFRCMDLDGNGVISMYEMEYCLLL